MAIPVINTTTSVQGWKQWESWEFQPFATGNPVIWQASALPTGLSMAAAPTLYAATSAVSSTTDVITVTGHPFANGDKVFFSDITGGAGLAVNTTYFARDVVAGTSLKLAATLAGTAINFTTDITAANLSAVHTGKISGAVTVPGITTAGIIAVNESGASAALALTIGIEPTASSTNAGADLFIDVETGIVIAGAAKTTAAGEVPPLFSAKEGDDLLLFVQFRRGQTTIDLGALTSLKFSLKVNDGEAVVLTGGGSNAGTYTGVTGAHATNIINAPGSAFANGDKFFFSVLVGTAGELVINQTYFARDVSGTSFKAAATRGGAAIDFTTTDISASTIKSVRFYKDGSGTSATYICYVSFTGSPLSAALDDNEAAPGTAFVGLGEMEWVQPGNANVGPPLLTRTTKTFKAEVVRDQIE